jgi:hypothetical protein
MQHLVCSHTYDPGLGQMMTQTATSTNETTCPQQVPINFREFLFLYVGHKLESFPPLKCTDFVKCVREL